jgi:hypothetical protein
MNPTFPKHLSESVAVMRLMNFTPLYPSWRGRAGEEGTEGDRDAAALDPVKAIRYE